MITPISVIFFKQKTAYERRISDWSTDVCSSDLALQLFGAAGYSRNTPLERMVRDARMFTIGGGTAQILRTVIASRILDRKLPQTRDGYLNLQIGRAHV